MIDDRITEQMNSMHTPRYSPFIGIVYCVVITLSVYASYATAFVWKLEGFWLNFLVTLMIVLTSIMVVGYAERYSIHKYMEGKYGTKSDEDEENPHER